MPIPAILLEEHNEALLAWNWAVRRGIIRERDNFLLHVDEHADMEAPHFNRSILEVAGDRQTLADFTYREVAIYEFIVAAVFQGMFSDVYWVRQGVKERAENKLLVFSERNEGKKLMLRPDPTPEGVKLSPDGVDDHRGFLFVVQGTRPEIPRHDSTVLDIDLDFFSSDQAEHRVDRLEVTRDEFQKYERDNHHFLRLDFGSRVTAHQESGPYYFHFRDYTTHYQCRSKVSREAIQARLTLFSRMLKRLSVQPKLITIARSRISGYTPADQCEDIEKNLLECLGSHFELNLATIDQLLDPAATIGH